VPGLIRWFCEDHLGVRQSVPPVQGTNRIGPHSVTFVALRRHCRKVWKGNGKGRGLLS
jgi:hypothetical protein